MPIPVKHICPKCKGESDTAGYECIPCSFHKILKDQGSKHLQSHYVTSDKKDKK